MRVDDTTGIQIDGTDLATQAQVANLSEKVDRLAQFVSTICYGSSYMPGNPAPSAWVEIWLEYVKTGRLHSHEQARKP